MEKQKTQYPGLRNLFFVFFKVGVLTIGGGLAMLSVLRHELVLGRKWLDDEEFSKQVTMATGIPGAIIVNFSLIHGFNARGWKGAFFSCFAVVLPSFIVMLIVAAFLFPYSDLPVVASFLKGASASVAAIIAHTALFLGRSTLKRQTVLKLVLTVVAIIISLAPGIHPVIAVIVVGVGGYFLLGSKGDQPGENNYD